ncbi:MAG: zinc ABC transporter substrate-binding protein, partial [Pyramidobacter sp.]|nr:zinc ABC transporter substrate-binding protein [Pyramidobacter sp.]
MEKRISRLWRALPLALALAVCALCAAAGAKPRVVTTLFPVYDWTRAIIGERAGQVELEPPLNTGVDLHSFQPSVDDILRISSCDLFVYVGGESDAWVKRVLHKRTDTKPAVISLIDALGPRARAEEAVEGMESGHHHHHEHHEEEHGHHEHGKGHHEHDEGPELDEHVWLSLVNVR